LIGRKESKALGIKAPSLTRAKTAEAEGVKNNRTDSSYHSCSKCKAYNHSNQENCTFRKKTPNYWNYLLS